MWLPLSEEKEIYVMSHGLFRNEKDQEPIRLEKTKLLVNGAILTFEWISFDWTYRKGRTQEVFGFKVKAKNVEGPFGIIDELVKDDS